MGCDSDTVVSFVDGLGLLASLAPNPFLFCEAIGAETFDVIRWLAFQQGLHEQMADSRRTGNSVRIATARHHKSPYSTAFSNDESSIRRKRRPTFRDRLNLGRSG